MPEANPTHAKRDGCGNDLHFAVCPVVLCALPLLHRHARVVVPAAAKTLGFRF